MAWIVNPVPWKTQPYLGAAIGPELEAEFPVQHPASLCCQPFPGADGGQGANHGGQVTVAFGFNLEYAKSSIVVGKGDPFDYAIKRVLLGGRSERFDGDQSI